MRTTLPLLALTLFGAAPRDETRTLVLHWPVPESTITSLYGYRPDPLTRSERFHAGVDIEAPYGSLVAAAADGLVIAAGWHKGHGRFVEIEHAGGYVTRYAHLSQVLVFRNTQVHAGTHIGRVGNSGRSTGAHLHLEVLLHGVPRDPLDLLERGLPIDAPDVASRRLDVSVPSPSR